jgi:hypothetical protein
VPDKDHFMKAVEAYAGEGQLSWLGGSCAVSYRLTRLQGMAANGLPVPGLFRIEGDLDLGGEPVPSAAVNSPVMLTLGDGRSMRITLTTPEGRVLSEGHGPSCCLCC